MCTYYYSAQIRIVLEIPFCSSRQRWLVRESQWLISQPILTFNRKKCMEKLYDCIMLDFVPPPCPTITPCVLLYMIPMGYKNGWNLMYRMLYFSSVTGEKTPRFYLPIMRTCTFIEKLI